MEMSLEKDIERALSKVKISFHMPAHKYRDSVLRDFSHLDTTEIYGTDNLHNAKSCIRDAENRIAGIYGSQASRLLVAGSSSGLISAIFALSSFGDKIIIGRDSHKSIFNACKIRNLSYICVPVKMDDSGLPCDYEGYYELLMAHPEVKLCVLTSPNYYGRIREFKSVADEMQGRGGYLIVDEAHGAHLEFTHLKKYSGLAQGASAAIQSAHKMLPSMGMGAILHYGCNLDAVAVDKVDGALSMFQSSSPSYPIMISVDYAVMHMEENRQLVDSKCMDFSNFFISQLQEYSGGQDASIRDPFKIFISALHKGYSGFNLQAELIKEGIYPEFADYNGVLLYLSHLNELQELETLLDALSKLAIHPSLPLRKLVYPALNKNAINAGKSDAKCEIIGLSKALGRVCMEDVVPYPPGVPLLLEGELIDEGALEALMQLEDFPQHIKVLRG